MIVTSGLEGALNDLLKYESQSLLVNTVIEETRKARDVEVLIVRLFIEKDPGFLLNVDNVVEAIKYQVKQDLQGTARAITVLAKSSSNEQQILLATALKKVNNTRLYRALFEEVKQGSNPAMALLARVLCSTNDVHEPPILGFHLPHVT